MKMEQTECSETSAYKLQTPGNYTKESIQVKESDLLAYNSASLGEWCHVLKEIIFCIFKVSVVHHLCAPETLKIDVRNHLPNKAA